MAPFWTPFRSEWATLWEVRGIEFSTRDGSGTLISISFFGLSSLFGELFFLGGQKISKCEHSKNHLNHAMDRPKMHVVWYILFQESASHQKRSVHRKNASFFEFFGSLIFALCFVPSAARTLRRTKKDRGIEIRFLGILGPF